MGDNSRYRADSITEVVSVAFDVRHSLESNVTRPEGFCRGEALSETRTMVCDDSDVRESTHPLRDVRNRDLMSLCEEIGGMFPMFVRHGHCWKRRLQEGRRRRSMASFVSYLSFRPSVPFLSDSSFLSVSVLFLHTRLLADLCI
jgi:hypothetical protein